MSCFTSSKEKHLWGWTLVVFAAIVATLFMGEPLVKFFGSQDVQALVFVLGMVLAGTAILINAIKRKPGRMEWVLWFGVLAVYVMLFLRLGLPERSHLFEYSILAILVQDALIERKNNGSYKGSPALWAMLMVFSVGVLDEIFQLFLPYRVFDPLDILFNGFVIAVAIGAKVMLTWGRKFTQKNQK
ncbi:VanZ family protein [Arenibacter amylolyticus]|uniref:VanZ family protein n=1 Tax=Arenibacter amylolyticus TaxID=1406873 RepID=UPI000A362C0A|nr:VanZ family protein [Arenibacter amylolyticus]